MLSDFSTIVDQSFIQELPQDEILNRYPRQVYNACYSIVSPTLAPDPNLIHANELLLSQMGIDTNFHKSDKFLSIFSGIELLDNTSPYAMCYGGHQFGHWAGQLGDGRAINLFDIVNNHKRWAFQLKGAGPTPYSRTADGYAVLRSSIREHLCSEAMYHLGVPTTRSLSLISTGRNVMRDVMYDGNAAYEKGAIVCRVAPSFLRFGNFQIFASRKDYTNLKKISDFTIKHFFKELEAENNKYLSFFDLVMKSTLEMIIHWERVGFVHGVMNTDNMSILGLTIDYGPYGWLENYDPDWTPNTTDKINKRYRFGNQAAIAQWNLLQLANALYPIIKDSHGLELILNQYRSLYFTKRKEMRLKKLGIQSEKETDPDLIIELDNLLIKSNIDMTIFYRNLSNFDKAKEGMTQINEAFYDEKLVKQFTTDWVNWFKKYEERLAEEKTDKKTRKAIMNAINPKYVLRNYMAQQAIEKAEKGNYHLMKELYTMLQRPYEEQIKYQKYFAKRPKWADHKIGCSMLSCSS